MKEKELTIEINEKFNNSLGSNEISSVGISNEILLPADSDKIESVIKMSTIEQSQVMIEPIIILSDEKLPCCNPPIVQSVSMEFDNDNGQKLNEDIEYQSVTKTMPEMTLANNMEIDHESDVCNDNMEILKDLKFMEICRYSWNNTKDKQFYTRGCLWSPDGTCILMATNLDGMHVFELPSDVYEMKSLSSKRPLQMIQSAIHVKEGGTVYDYTWYPLMNSNAPETCCWIATRQHEPIHMWDAFNGELRCTYRGYDAVDEVETAIAVTFTHDGTKILGGYKKSIKIFDTVVPGRDYTQIDTKHPSSCFALHFSHTNLIGVGSWKSNIHLYDLRSPKLGCLTTLSQHNGGVTFMKFSHTGQTLFSGARKDNQLIEWDMRNFTKPLKILNRSVETNQRIYFDICSSGEWLMSGDTTGILHTWNLQQNYKEYKFSLHKDCCNGISTHPTKSILATTSGQYHFIPETMENEKELKVKLYENSFIIWWSGEII